MNRIALVYLLVALAATTVSADPDCYRYEHVSRWTDALTLPAPAAHAAGWPGHVACATADDLLIVDVSDPAAPAMIGQTPLIEPATAMAIAGNYAVVGSAAGALYLYDISSPADPAFTAVAPHSVARIRDLQAGPGWLATADADGVLRVQRHPEGGVPGPGWIVDPGGEVHGVALWKGRLLAVGETGLTVIAVPAPDDPGDPVIERTLQPAPEDTYLQWVDAAVLGDLALVATEWYLPIEPRGDSRYEPFETNLFLSVRLSPAVPPADQLAGFFYLNAAGQPALAATGTVTAMAGTEAMLLDPSDLEMGLWLEPRLRFDSNMESRLAAAGSVLVRTDADQLRCLETAALEAAPPLHVHVPDQEARNVNGRWSMTSDTDHPADFAYWKKLWYFGDPMAPALVDSHYYFWSLESSQSAGVVAADGPRAVIELVTDTSAEFLLYDVGVDPIVKTTITNDEFRTAYLTGDRIVMAATDGIACWDITDPAAPTGGPFLPLEGYASQTLLAGDRLFALTIQNVLWVVDVSDPAAPALVTSFGVPDGSRLRGPAAGMLLLDDGAGTATVIDAAGQVRGTVTGTGPISTVVSDAALAAVAWRDEGVDLVDFSDPDQPVRLGRTVFLDGLYVYDLDWGAGTGDQRLVYAGLSEKGLRVLDFRGPAPRAYGNGWKAYQMTVLPEGLLTGRGLLPLQCDDLTGVDDPVEPDSALPELLSLSPVAPNPFNPRAVIRFATTRADQVTVTLHDLRGRRVRSLVNGPLAAGNHTRSWNGADDSGHVLPSGTYLVRVAAGGEVKTTKAQLVR